MASQTNDSQSSTPRPAAPIQATPSLVSHLKPRTTRTEEQEDMTHIVYLQQRWHQLEDLKVRQVLAQARPMACAKLIDASLALLKTLLVITYRKQRAIHCPFLLLAHEPPLRPPCLCVFPVQPLLPMNRPRALSPPLY